MAKPEELDLVLWYDLSSMRPDEFARTNARRWTEAVRVRKAYLDGFQDADAEHAAQQEQEQWLRQQVQMDA